MRRAVVAISILVGAASAINGAAMLADALRWFGSTPIVWRTGLPNAHFIRDVGWTYVAVGTVVMTGALRPRWTRPTIGLAIVWLAGHGVIHLGEVVTGVCSRAAFLSEWPIVWGPVAFLAVALLMDGAIRGRQGTAAS